MRFVPNLGHELLILIMSCTYLPSFNIKFVREVSFLKKKSQIFLMESIVAKFEHLTLKVIICDI